MKITQFFFLIISATFLIFISSCSNEDDVSPDAKISFIGVDNDSATVVAGDTLRLSVRVDKGGYNLQELAVYSNITGSFNQVGTGINLNDEATQTQEISYPVPINATSEFALRFDVLQQDRPVVSKTINVTVEPTSVVGIAAGNPDFSILVQALTQTNLTTTLNGEGPFTVFAPTNAAFNALLDEMGITEQELLQSPDLENILKYHVINAELPTADITNGADIETLLPGKYITAYTEGGLRVNNSLIDPADLSAKNGIVHVIDKVLTPTANIDTFNTVLLMAPIGVASGERTSETFFSTILGSRFSVDEVVAGSGVTSEDIDFGYYYGVTSKASLASPAQYPNDIYDLGPNGANWSTLNSTKFRTTTFSAEAFDAIKENQDYKLSTEFEVGTDPENTERVTELTEGNIIAFKTFDDRFGLIKVIEVVDGDSDGSFIGAADGLRISVKVTR